MQFMQFVYGVATSTEVAYYTYIYAKVRLSPHEQFGTQDCIKMILRYFDKTIFGQDIAVAIQNWFRYPRIEILNSCRKKYWTLLQYYNNFLKAAF
jgi:hypothetical protein